jgi:hypothetical protein
MITKKLDDKIKLTAKTVNVKIGQEVKVVLKVYDENKKVLKQKEYKEKVQENKKVEKRFTISNLADELNIDSSKVKYVSGWIDADDDAEITREYEKEVWIEVEKEKKKLHFLFYTLTGSKNDEIFIEQVNLKEKIIKEDKNYNNKIDIVYKKEVKTSSEILKFVKNKIKENSDNIKVEVKTVELFAELFKEKKEHKKETHIDTSNHWINNLAQPHIPNDMNIEEAYVEQTSTAILLTTTGKVPFQFTLFFGFVNGASKTSIYYLERQKAEDFIIKLAFDTFVDTVAGNSKYIQIANELIIKPYFSYIYDKKEK